MLKININTFMNVVTPLIQFQQNIRLSHWQTDSYAQHQAFGKTYEALDGLIDGLIEAYMGVFGRLKSNISFSIELKGLPSLETSIKDFLTFLGDLRARVGSHSDLQNMVDEIIGAVNTLKYLLTLQ
jgi:hypothetical protein